MNFKNWTMKHTNYTKESKSTFLFSSVWFVVIEFFSDMQSWTEQMP
jgi:hypothetical protein